MTGASALSAGFILILVSLCVTGAGIAMGHHFGEPVIGGFIGGILGILLGFYVVWKMYLVPLRAASLSRDLSHLKSQWDEDD